MRQLLLVMSLFLMASPGFGQQGQTILSLDSRVGYSTNSFLNPLLGEWDTSIEGGYSFSSLMVQSFWYGKGHSFSVTGGVIYEPYFDKQVSNWKGGIGLVDYNYWLANKISIGVEGGSSYMHSQYSRTLLWVQPKLTWFLTPFTLLRTKLGPNSRRYQNYGGVREISDRLDLYSLEFETWPTYRWRLTAGIYGRIDKLPDIRKGYTTRVSAGYHFRNGASISLTGKLQQYQFKQTITESNPRPDIFPPISGGTTTTVVGYTDRIMRLGLIGSLPLGKRFTLFADVGSLYFLDDYAENTVRDFKVSGGLRFSFNPKLNKRGTTITPEWNNDRNQQELYIKYAGNGRLYLVGSFNNWNKNGIPLTEQPDETYTTQLSLEVGAHEYKILRVQGDSEEWLEFSDEVYTVEDGFGSKNAMLLVE